jgi:hypothetical protein
VCAMRTWEHYAYSVAELYMEAQGLRIS